MAVGLNVEAIDLYYGAAKALKSVSIEARPAAITAVLGRNGVGKSSLLCAVAGTHPVAKGEVRLDGAALGKAPPYRRARLGLGYVPQGREIFPLLTVKENLQTGFAPLPARERSIPETVFELFPVLAQMLSRRGGDLSGGQQQQLAIGRALVTRPKVLILDEPTSSLSSAEANRLFALIDRLRERGVAILYISHRMSDIRRLADRIVSLRDGQIAGVFADRPLDYEAAVNAMLGQAMGRRSIEARAATRTVFAADGLKLAEGARPFSLSLGDGEVVAVTGLVGVGKTALAETLFGARRPLGGTMTLNGSAYAPASPGEAIAAGAYLVAKDRSENGIVRDFNVYENMSLPFLRRLSAFGVSRRRAERTLARRQIADLGIVCRSERDDMATLSGGNQQKVMVARWMAQGASLFMLDEPFQGVDIAARHDIAAKLRASAAGRATLIFVTELDEALETADRILVMSEHTIVGEHVNAGVDIDRLLAEVAGQPVRGAA